MVKTQTMMFLLVCVAALVLLGWLTPGRWSPYAAGALIGILSWMTFLLSGRGLGASTAYMRFSGMLARLADRRAVDHNEYYEDVGVRMEWQTMLVVGILAGAFVSAVLSGAFALRWVPDGWRAAFGGDVSLRLPVAFLGGMLVALGSRWAGGCTSGNGITQTLQMSFAGWIAALCFFAGGIATAMLIYGPGGLPR
jgi:uncharacterized membrane protein YedE/YeeE